MRKIVVGSGWWCSEEPDVEVNPGRKRLGAEDVRAVGFFSKWLNTLRATGLEADVVVVDSCAPIKPPEEIRSKVYWIELPFNAKHSTNHTGRWSGWMRSVLAGGSYAVTVEAEYFVYVEQDCLLSGKGIVETAISKMKTGLMFGSGTGTPQPVQQSFFIVRNDRLPSFLKNLTDLNKTDQELPPEWKFVLASWRPLVWASNKGLLNSKWSRRIALNLTLGSRFEFLPFSGGRSRPLQRESAHFYFQHGSEEELDWFFSRAA